MSAHLSKHCIMLSKVTKNFPACHFRQFSFLVCAIRKFSGIDIKTCQALNFIDGRRVEPASNEDEGKICIMEPASGKILCETQGSGKPEVDKAVQSARKAFTSWSAMSGMERGKILREAAKIIRARVNELATVEVADNGKTPGTSWKYVKPELIELILTLVKQSSRLLFKDTKAINYLLIK